MSPLPPSPLFAGAGRALNRVARGSDPGAVRDFLDRNNLQIEQMVSLIRRPLTPLQRAMLSALLILDVHSRDVVAALVARDVRSQADFEWIKQLRYYWSTAALPNPGGGGGGGHAAGGGASSPGGLTGAGYFEKGTGVQDEEPEWPFDEKGATLDDAGDGTSADPSSGDPLAESKDDEPEEVPDSEDVIIRQTNARFVYGYEYLGCMTRLVVTPLTDKAYLTLTGALHLHYGGAPAGPAGTGKTETVKDLGKALAIRTVVYNCSDRLDVKFMAQYFSGFAQTGQWVRHCSLSPVLWASYRVLFACALIVAPAFVVAAPSVSSLAVVFRRVQSYRDRSVVRHRAADSDYPAGHRRR
jgi:hypothetical protein